MSAQSGRSAPRDADLATEIAALAALLAEVVELAADNALFPSRWALIAELALAHDSVRAVLQAENTASAPPGATTPPLTVERIVTQLEQLRDLVPDPAGQQ